MTAGKLDLKKDLKFGTLNALEDVNVNSSGDRRRTTALASLNSTLRGDYDPNTLEDIDRFKGIIVHKRKVTMPRYADKMSLLESYVASSANPQETGQSGSASDSPETGVSQTYQTAGQTVYKVYIPEIEPRPAPKGPKDPVLRTYPDIYASAGRVDLQELPLGALVEVEYDDPARLHGPKIVEGHKERFVLMANYEEEQNNSALMFGNGPTHLLSSISSGDQAAGSGQGPILRSMLLIGDSQSDGGGTLGGYLPKELTKMGYNMEVEAKYGKGIVSGKAYWDISNQSGLLQQTLKRVRPEYVVVELGGNDSYWVGAGTSESKRNKYQDTMKTWIETIRGYGNPTIYWFGPSKAISIGSNGTPYDSLRQNVRDWQREYLPTVGATWYDTVPYTENLAMKDDGVHFVGASYKEWAASLVQPSAPLGGLPQI